MSHAESGDAGAEDGGRRPPGAPGTGPLHEPGWLSVIIPVLDEEVVIGDRLAELRALCEPVEVVCVDGGSRDRTRELIARQEGVRLLAAARGRASQMNAGAAAAAGQVLLFLHADTALPHEAPRLIRAALCDPAVVAGAFRTWTVADRPAGRLPSALLHLADLRSRYTRLPYGDQALFVRREAFAAVGGFPGQALLEDLELSRRLRRVGRIRTVAACVRVSGRRFQARPLYYTLLANAIPILYRAGVSPARLARLWSSPR